MGDAASWPPVHPVNPVASSSAAIRRCHPREIRLRASVVNFCRLFRCTLVRFDSIPQVRHQPPFDLGHGLAAVGGVAFDLVFGDAVDAEVPGGRRTVMRLHESDCHLAYFQ